MTPNLPPERIIEAARKLGERSPCAKSKRGVVLFDPDPDMQPEPGRDDHLPGRGWNGPPPGFECAGTEVCRSKCRSVCMHAEQIAIIDALRGNEVMRDLVLLHVKVVDGVIVAGGPPSCVECSRLIVQVQLRGVWLFESTDMGGWEAADYAPSDPLCTCGAREKTEPGDVVCHGPACPAMLHFAAWCHYDAERFHQQTLINTGAGMLADVRP